MYIITIEGKEEEGAYSVLNENGDHVLYIFQEEDDAVRYAMMLEENNFPEMHVLEVDKSIIIKACEMHDYEYVVITPDDIVIPPDTENYFV